MHTCHRNRCQAAKNSAAVLARPGMLRPDLTMTMTRSSVATWVVARLPHQHNGLWLDPAVLSAAKAVPSATDTSVTVCRGKQRRRSERSGRQRRWRPKQRPRSIPWRTCSCCRSSAWLLPNQVHLQAQLQNAEVPALAASPQGSTIHERMLAAAHSALLLTCSSVLSAAGCSLSACAAALQSTCNLSAGLSYMIRSVAVPDPCHSHLPGRPPCLQRLQA